MLPISKNVAVTLKMFFVLTILLTALSLSLYGKKKIKDSTNLMPENRVRALWEALPFPFYFGIHVFNVTNPQDVEKGLKPVLRDVGPYVFDEFKDKYNIQDDEATDSVSFNMRNTYKFRPDKTEGFTGEEHLTIPHPLIQMMAISVKRQSADMIKGVAEGLRIIFNNASPFITAPFMDLFFRGIPINCDQEHPAAQAVCDIFRSGSIRGIKMINETYLTFSLMGENNHTDSGRFKVLRGTKNFKDVGKVLEFNGQTMLNVWSADECNKFQGTDGTIFPPYMEKESSLWSFSAELCRSMAPIYRRKVHHEGFVAGRYLLDFGDIRNEKDKTCFCPSYPDNCPAKGTMDLSPCTKTPMIVSMPHFLNSDDILKENVLGVHPDINDHGTHIDIELITGTPLSVYKRIQFNLDMEPVTEVKGMENLKKIVVPMFWFDENFKLPTIANGEIALMFRFLFIKNLFQWIGLVISFYTLVHCYFSFKREKIRRPIQPVA